MTPRELLLRARAWLRRDRLDSQLSAELEAHAELLARDFQHEGLSPTDAKAAARRQLGNTTSLRESSRDAWGFPALEHLLQDLRYAVRGLVHAPGFTLTVVITLGLGIGANAAMFAVIDRLMFRPFPYMRDPGAVHSVYVETNITRRNTYSTIPYTRYQDLVRASQSFSQHAAVSEWRFAVGLGQETRITKVAGISASFFSFFDMRPAQGRFFGPAEDQVPMGSLVAVLGYDYWRVKFGERDVLGQQLRIGKLDYTIIGVAPMNFVGTVQGSPPEIFVPITTIPANHDEFSRLNYYKAYNWDWMEVLVRRKPGVSESAATAELTAAYKQSRRIQRETNPRVLPDSVARPRAMVAALRSAAGPNPGPESRVLLWAVGVAAIVLLIACANVANLMLARVLRRQREIAVRLALGVSRGRLMGQFVLEAVLLATIGITAGLVFAQWGGAAIRQLLLPEGSTFDLATDWRTIRVASALALAAALLTTIGPAVLAARSNLTSSLKTGARGGTYRRSTLRSALLVTQGALSVVLLIGAGLFIRSFNRVLDIPLGYDASRVVEVYPDFRELALDSASLGAAYSNLMATARSIPATNGATRVNSGFFRTNTAYLRVPGIDSVEQLGRFNVQVNSPQYFDVMRTRIIRGRSFTESDGAGAPPVAVVSNAMARVLWPGKDPIGQCLEVSWRLNGNTPEPAPCSTVIGVAEDAAYQSVTDEQRFVYYLNADQMGSGWAGRIYIRLAGRPTASELERVRSAMQAAMPGNGFVVVRPLQEVVDDQSRSWRLGATLFVAFGGLAVVVAAVGLYGVIGYTVAQRMHELGMRVALGAQSGHIVRLVLKQGIGFAAGGVTIGLVLALVASRWIEPLLYKQSPRDPVVFAAVCVLMISVGAIASAVPAMRAIRADPNRVLRAD
ncbi:MAG TPA: ABC transporter permease [Gemmatimonadaceae bacterium]|nr:ABC transporter permease [Gemmatimonadaceae bacterium]